MGTLGTSFGSASLDYDKGRPSYPARAVAWMLDGVEGGVADVGAGTGKLTRELLRLGLDVTAVDPDSQMLATLHRALPEVPTVVGSAESTTLADASQNAVVFGQAWHWVDVDRASTEMMRILRPGGVLGLIWNIRDDREPWVARLSEVMRGSNAEEMIAGPGPGVGRPFAPLQSYQETWKRTMTTEELSAMVRSRSYYITGDDDYRAQVDADLAVLMADIPAGEREGSIDLPYVTHAFRSVRP